MRKPRPYLLLDARAGCTLADRVDLDKYTILYTGTAKECCVFANRGEYGDGCVVAELDGEIRWDWFATGAWRPE